MNVIIVVILSLMISGIIPYRVLHNDFKNGTMKDSMFLVSMALWMMMTLLISLILQGV